MAELMVCVVGGCTGMAHCKELCSMHYSRWVRNGTTDPPEIQTVEQRYWRHVVRTETGCWDWSGTTDEHGYGRFARRRAHRYSYEIHVGPIPDGLHVMHRCDNPPCTNPEHLTVGTHTDNMADASRKGRLDGRANRPCGEANKLSKLTDRQVQEIRHLRTAGVPRVDVAAWFGVSKKRISEITTGKAWRHI